MRPQWIRLIWEKTTVLYPNQDIESSARLITAQKKSCLACQCGAKFQDAEERDSHFEDVKLLKKRKKKSKEKRKVRECHHFLPIKARKTNKTKAQERVRLSAADLRQA